MAFFDFLLLFTAQDTKWRSSYLPPQRVLTGSDHRWRQYLLLSFSWFLSNWSFFYCSPAAFAIPLGCLIEVSLSCRKGEKIFYFGVQGCVFIDRPEMGFFLHTPLPLLLMPAINGARQNLVCSRDYRVENCSLSPGLQKLKKGVIYLVQSDGTKLYWNATSVCFLYKKSKINLTSIA